jgi:hypothetical protein
MAVPVKPADGNLVIRSFRYFVESVAGPHGAFERLETEETYLQPWLNIPADMYRYYELFFYVPYGIAAWILTAGFAQTLSLAFGGKGSYTGTLNVACVVERCVDVDRSECCPQAFFHQIDPHRDRDLGVVSVRQHHLHPITGQVT